MPRDPKETLRTLPSIGYDWNKLMNTPNSGYYNPTQRVCAHCNKLFKNSLAPKVYKQHRTRHDELYYLHDVCII